MRILRYKQLESTNTTAYQLGEQGEPEWTIIVADTQTRGRGRDARKWESAKGGLWFSILLRPDIPTARLPILQFLAANATRQALEDEAGVHVQLKWPNDLVIGTGKLGGILVESKIGERIKFVVIGIGLNINQPNSLLPGGATSLQVVGARVDRRRLLRAIINHLRSRYDQLAYPSKILNEWWRNCIHRPLYVHVVSQEGPITGITRDLDEDGSLIIETDDHRIQRVSEGYLRVTDEGEAILNSALLAIRKWSDRLKSE